VGLVGVGGDRRGPATGAVPQAVMAAALSPTARRVDDGEAMGGFIRVGRSRGARRCDVGARARGSRRAAAGRRRHGSGTSAETRGTRWNEESMSFSESRKVDSSLWLSKMMTGSRISPPSGSWRPWRATVASRKGRRGLGDSGKHTGEVAGRRAREGSRTATRQQGFGGDARRERCRGQFGHGDHAQGEGEREKLTRGLKFLTQF